MRFIKIVSTKSLLYKIIRKFSFLILTLILFITLPTIYAGAMPDVKIISTTYDPPEISPGETTYLTVTIENRGDMSAYYGSVELSMQENDEQFIDIENYDWVKNNYHINYEFLSAGERVSKTFKIRASEYTDPPKTIEIRIYAIVDDPEHVDYDKVYTTLKIVRSKSEVLGEVRANARYYLNKAREHLVEGFYEDAIDAAQRAASEYEKINNSTATLEAAQIISDANRLKGLTEREKNATNILFLAQDAYNSGDYTEAKKLALESKEIYEKLLTNNDTGDNYTGNYTPDYAVKIDEIDELLTDIEQQAKKRFNSHISNLSLVLILLIMFSIPFLVGFMLDAAGVVDMAHIDSNTLISDSFMQTMPLMIISAVPIMLLSLWVSVDFNLLSTMVPFYFILFLLIFLIFRIIFFKFHGKLLEYSIISDDEAEINIFIYMLPAYFPTLTALYLIDTDPSFLFTFVLPAAGYRMGRYAGYGIMVGILSLFLLAGGHVWSIIPEDYISNNSLMTSDIISALFISILMAASLLLYLWTYSRYYRQPGGRRAGARAASGGEGTGKKERHWEGFIEVKSASDIPESAKDPYLGEDIYGLILKGNRIVKCRACGAYYDKETLKFYGYRCARTGCPNGEY